MHERTLRIDPDGLRAMAGSRGWVRGCDIAAGLGVSPATISRALRGGPVGALLLNACTSTFGPAAFALVRSGK